MRKRDLAIGAMGLIGGVVAVKMLTREKTVDWNTVSDKVLHSGRSKFTSVDGTRVHYQEFGNSTDPAIILIHGFTASVYVWSNVAPQIADAGFHVIAVDLVGFGYSEKPSWFDYTINSQARMIVRLMDKLGIGRAVMTGSSYGGAVAATIALDHPDRVEKLVLVGAVINDDVKNHPLLRLASIPGIGEAMTPFLIDSKIFLRRRMYLTLAPVNHHLIDDERVANVQRPLAAADGHHSVLATSRNWHANRIEKDAHLIVHQTLLIWGEEDKVIPLINGYKLYGSVVNSRLVVLKNCGHVPQEEMSDLFTRLVTEFCHDREGRIEAKENEDMMLDIV
ncbi:MAG: alpha/beta hydrolase [Acidobacteria bacterium]|nr:alpha/beta hydrolase [Acidobacteriota bacterium]